MSAKRPPLVMLHGAFAGPWSFDSFRKPFEAAGYTVHAPVLRHHDRGMSPPRELGGTGLLDYAKDLAKFIDGLDEPPILLGHSLGGLLAQMLAARGKARVLMLLAPSPPWGVLPTTLFEIASAQTIMMHGPIWNQVLRPDYEVAASASLDKLSKAERKRVYTQFVPESGQATFEIMHWGWDARRASHVDPKKVTCPVWCVTGEHDKINPPGTVQRVAARYGAVFHEIPGHSHWLLGEEGWEDIAAVALKWLDGALRARR